MVVLFLIVGNRFHAYNSFLAGHVRQGLPGLQAGTLVDNVASQRVLTKNGFGEIGLAPRYLQIDGAYRDHILFQLLSDDKRPYSAPSNVSGPAT